MMDVSDTVPYKNRSVVIRLLGILLLCGGVFLAVLGLLELQCFPLFSTGGRFHYDGFGYGSFMFFVIAVQIVIYLALAAVFIPLGYGHIRLRGWILRLTPACLWAWLAVGIPLLLLAFFLLLGVKDLSMAGVIVSMVLLALAYALPALLIRFYRGRNAVGTLRAKDAGLYWIDRMPVPVLVSLILCLFHVVVLFILNFLNFIFPLFGIFLSGLPGSIANIFSTAWLIICIFGLLKLRPWAWWLSLAFFALFLVSTVLTFTLASYAGLLAVLSFPADELVYLKNLPLQGYHFALLICPPVIAGLVSTILSKRTFKPFRGQKKNG